MCAARMEVPVHDVVNTGEELIREGLPGKQGFISVSLSREASSAPWGFRLQGGKDRGLPFQLLKVTGAEFSNLYINIHNIVPLSVSHLQSTNTLDIMNELLNAVFPPQIGMLG